MLKTMVLTCLMGIDPSVCMAETALDVMVFPPTRVCGLPQEATVAGTAIAPEMGKSFAKIVFERIPTKKLSARASRLFMARQYLEH